MTVPGYLSYKKTESGRVAEIPEHWSDGRLKDVLAASVTDGPHTTPEFLADGVPFLSVDAIQDGELILEGCRFISADDHAEYRRKTAPRFDDLLMGKAASTGKIARVKTQVEFSIWSPLALIRIDKIKASPSYIEYALKSTSVQAEIDNYCTANTQKNIGMVDIPKLRIVRPPLAEQRQIADYLDVHTAKIDVLIEKQEQLIEALTERRQALLSGTFEGAVVGEHAASGATHARRIKYLYSVIDQRAGNAQLPLLSVSIHRGVQRRDEVTDDAPRSNDLSVYKVCRPGDVIVNRMRAFQGAVGLALESGLVSPDYLVLRTGGLIDERWFTMLMRSRWFVGEMTARIRGIGSTEIGTVRTPRINASDLGEICIIVPSLAEQKSLSLALSRETAQMDALSVKAREMIEVLKERRQALISAAVTGTIDVRGLS